MGVFPANCRICNKAFMWFSGLPAQVCSECFSKPESKPKDEPPVATEEDIAKFMQADRELMGGWSEQDDINIRLGELKSAHTLIGKLIKELEDASENE